MYFPEWIILQYAPEFENSTPKLALVDIEQPGIRGTCSGIGKCLFRLQYIQFYGHTAGMLFLMRNGNRSQSGEYSNIAITATLLFSFNLLIRFLLPATFLIHKNYCSRLRRQNGNNKDILFLKIKIKTSFWKTRMNRKIHV